jgi:asparaginyl-tRNA synthetase
VADILAGGKASIGQTATVGGWARTVRASGKNMAFITLSDGSCFNSLQVVVEASQCPDLEAVNSAGGTGACFLVTGQVVQSPGKGQDIDLMASSVQVLGTNVPGEYPLAKARISLEKLRTLQHLRPRSNMFGAVTRVRNALSYATHRFYQERGFMYIHTPLISTSDCEGAGEQFGVTTLLPEDPTKDLPRTKTGAIDYKKDFFGRQASLTVSGQLQVEAFACSMSDVYTFGPTFRAEDSHTSRHLAEFWMIEPEIAFAGLQEDMDLAEDFVKYCTRYVLQYCADDIAFFDKFVEKGLVQRLENVADSPFARITYTDAIAKLTEPALLKKAKFTEKPYWGIDLGSEHERYLTEQVFKRPTIIYDYPKGIKAFYMRVNEDDKTVAALDVLVPKIGELVGGSVREEREDVLKARMRESGVEPESMEWYTQLRRYGTVPHAGFGVGFERLVMYVTGVENIRDVIPFPRYPGHADI